MIPLCLTLSNIRYISKVKWKNPGKRVVPSPTPRCRSYWKGSLLVALDYRHQLYFIVILRKFQPICPLAFFRYFMLNSGVHTESRTEPFILTIGVDCSNPINYDWVQVLSERISLNFRDEIWLFLSLRIFRLLISSLLWYNVLADMSFGLLQVFHVKLRSPQRISNWTFYLKKLVI